MITKQSNPSVADIALRLPSDIPQLPDDVLQRFESLRAWSDEAARFWSQAQNALNDFARATLDVTEVAGILVVDPDAGALYIKPTRGEGRWASADTGFYVDRESYFSLGSALTWNPKEQELVIDGTIIATSGTIGGFEIGTDYIRDVANTFGLASTVTGGDDVRLWAGDTFANRASAPFRVTESGALVATSATISGTITATSGTIGGFSIGSDYIRDAANSFGLASTVTGADDVRFWAGATFANRTIAPVRIYESGDVAFNNALIGDFEIGFGAINSSGAATSISIANDGTITWLGTGIDPVLSRSAANEITLSSLLVVNGSLITSINASNIASGTLDAARMPSSFGGTFTGTVDTTYLEAGVTTRVDIKDVNLAVYNGATQELRVDYTNGDIYIQNVRVVRAQYGTPNPGGGTDPEGVWAAACLVYHGLGA